MKRLEEQERIAASTTTSQYPTDKNYHFTTTTTTTTRLVPIKATESITGNFLDKRNGSFNGHMNDSSMYVYVVVVLLTLKWERKEFFHFRKIQITVYCRSGREKKKKGAPIFILFFISFQSVVGCCRILLLHVCWFFHPFHQYFVSTVPATVRSIHQLVRF